MDERTIKWTEQQRRAISRRGSDVLVTASAGTGKTAVLSGRCVDIVSDKSICPDVRNILVLTFTDAAAEQMRSRIAEQLRTAFLKSGSSELRQHLRHQLVLLGGADISTIHSFCKRLITEHFYELELDPTFGIIDSDEQSLLKTEVLEKTIDWAWGQSHLASGLEQLLRRRDLRTNDGFLAKIIQLSNFLDGVISRNDWCERASLLAEAANPFTTDLGQRQKQIVAEKLRNILDQIRYAQKLYENENTGGNWAAKWEDTFVKPVSKCIEFLKAGDWQRCAEGIINFQKPSKFEYKPRGLEGPIAGVIKKTAQNAKNAFEGLSNLAILNPDYMDKVSGAVGLQTKVVIELVKKFDRLYSEAKGTINRLDFSDLEHYALRLLSNGRDSDDKLLPSQTALALRRRYKHIFVDEYQDINSVQQAILGVLSPGGNVLEVGDVKQSIYAFRGAEPDIFLKQLKNASADPTNAANGLRVDLNTNFRSAKGILDFVNRIFSRIMTASFAKIDYDESAELKPAKDSSKNEWASDTKPIVELHILDDKNSEYKIQNTEFSSRQYQAAMIARRINQMVGAESGQPEFRIYDKLEDRTRPVEYRDIVILMRSPAKKADDYVKVLRLAGVPVSCQAATGYFETTEIRDLLSLLKVLDNPQRDIELAAVLRSPLFNISDTELAKIRMGKGTDGQRHKGTKSNYRLPFYDCVLGYCVDGTDKKLSDRLKEILAQLERWRRLARRGHLADLIWQIYRQTGFLSFVCALANGQSRRANLLKLHDRAIQFEGFASSTGIASLTRFVEFIEKLQQSGHDWASAEPDTAVGNAVRIMSVHKSKGLEFPVVFLAELNGEFNKRDVQGDFLADTNDTLGLQIIDRRTNSRLTSLAHQVISERKLSAALAEEMRILYVAMTRARERLILTGCEKKEKCREQISNGFLFGEESIPDWQLRSCQEPLGWVLYGLCDQKNLHSAFETGLAEECVDDNLFSMKLYSERELEQLSNHILELKTSKRQKVKGKKQKVKNNNQSSIITNQLKRSLAWRYRFGDAPLLPAKRSVTQLTHRNDEYSAPPFVTRRLSFESPIVSRDAQVTGHDIGTATHLVIAKLDLGKLVSKKAIEKVKQGLLVNGAIDETVAAHINTASIAGFFESELGQTVLDSNNTVWREWPFTFAVPASEFSNSSHELRVTSDERQDTIIVQGIIDMLVQTPNGLLVIDFKTDNITAEQVAKRVELYREQLELYCRAAGAILKAEILGKWLYFLTPGCAVELV